MFIPLETAFTCAWVDLMGLVKTLSFGILVPQAIIRVGMSATAGLVRQLRCFDSALSLLERLLDSSSWQKLHVEMSHEENADIILDHRVLVHGNHNRDLGFREDLAYLLGVTSWDESYLYLIVWVVLRSTHQVIEPRLVEFVDHSSAQLFELKIELIHYRVKIPVARYMDHFWTLCQCLLERFKINGIPHDPKFLLLLLQNAQQLQVFIVGV